jgi:hypothetical protein
MMPYAVTTNGPELPQYSWMRREEFFTFFEELHLHWPPGNRLGHMSVRSEGSRRIGHTYLYVFSTISKESAGILLDSGRMRQAQYIRAIRAIRLQLGYLEA